MNKIRITIIIGVVGVFGISCLINYQGFFEKNSFHEVLTPWQSVGGCGAGVSGLSEFELSNIQEPYDYYAATTLGGKVSLVKTFEQKTSSLIISNSVFGSIKGIHFQFLCPIYFKSGEIQPSTLLQPQYSVGVGGIGDIAFSAKYLFALKIPLVTSLTLQCATGNFTEKRGSDKESYILPAYLQSGKGVNSLTANLAPILNLGKGRLKFQTSYTHPFVISFSGKNSLLDTWFYQFKSYEDSVDSPRKKRFYYGFKPYGENDLGDYFPPELSFSLAYIFPVRNIAEHIWNVNFMVPLGVSWVHEEQVDGSRFSYNPRINWDHHVWNASLQYGLEFNFPALSFFPTIQIPMHSVRPNYPDPISKWTRPDWKDFGQQFNFMVSVRTDYRKLKNMK